MVRFCCILLIALLAAPAAGALRTASAAGAQSPTPVGVWLHENGRIKVEIAPCGDRLCGTMVWFAWPNNARGLPLQDVNNPDPTLRSRALLGLTILRDLRRTGDNMWEDGVIYNPDDGTEYQAKMSIEDDSTLNVRAYVLFPLLGETMIWTRVE